jgi:ketosteroid isomerase-like protein
MRGSTKDANLAPWNRTSVEATVVLKGGLYDIADTTCEPYSAYESGTDAGPLQKDSQMNEAKKLLLELLAVIPDGTKAAALFAEDGVLELPFLHTVGVPPRHQGREAIKQFYDFVGTTLFPGMSFKPEDITVLIDTPDQVFAEFVTHTKAGGTGRLIHHLFAGRLVAENGKIKLLRESVNTAATAQALNPNGAADIPAPGEEVFSIAPDYVS